MKHKLLTALLCLFYLANNGQTVLKWSDTPIAINGNDTDWGEILRYYDNDTKLQYDIRNDSSFLYLVFSTGDETVQTKLQRAGATIYLKTKTKPKTSAKLWLPSITPSTLIGTNPGEKPSREQQRIQFILNKPNLLAEGFIYTTGGIPENDTAGIDYALNWDAANVLTLEIKIALRELGGDQYTLQELQAKKISLQLELRALEKPRVNDSNSTATQPAGMGGSGVGNMGGGMPRRGTINNNNTEFAERMWLFENQTLKSKFSIATGNN